GRSDPGGGWRMTPAIYAVAWVLLALGYTYSGYTKLISPSWMDGTALERVLNNPLARPGIARELVLGLPGWMLKLGTWGGLALELSFAPLALVPRLRPWIWGLMLLMHLNLIMLIDFADLSLGMVIIHFFTFDPAWIPPLKPSGESKAPEVIFYDGMCGLCHAAVRFVLAEDRAGDTFHFAPLQGETYQATVTPQQQLVLPSSVVVQTISGTMLTR